MENPTIKEILDGFDGFDANERKVINFLIGKALQQNTCYLYKVMRTYGQGAMIGMLEKEFEAIQKERRSQE